MKYFRLFNSRMTNDRSFLDDPITIKNTLTFFKNNITELNSRRLRFNRNKNAIKYFVDSAHYTKIISPLSTPLGVMSFGIYYVRLLSNIGLLVDLLLSKQAKQADQKLKNKQINELYYNIFNDLIWSTCNLVQFFWLAFSVSQSAGFRGLQLEALTQLIDFLIMIVRHEQDRQDYLVQLNHARGFERDRLMLAWHYKEINFIRSFIAVGVILLVFSTFAFSLAAIPIGPIIFSISLSNTLARVMINRDKDQKIMRQRCQQGERQDIIAEEKLRLSSERIKEVRQVLVDFGFLPACLYLIIAGSTPVVWIGLSSILIAWSALAYVTNNQALKSPDDTHDQLMIDQRLNEEISITFAC